MNKIEVEYVQHCGDDLMIANAARVSFGKKSEWLYDLCDCCPDAKDNCEECTCESGRYLKDADKRLIQFLARGMQSKDYEEFVSSVASAGSAVNSDSGMFKDDERLEELLWKFRDLGEHKSPFNHTFITVHVKAPISTARQLVKHRFMPWNEISGRYIEFKRGDVYIPNEFRSKAVDKKQGSGAALTGEAHDNLTAIFLDNAEKAFDDYQNALKNGLCEEQARNLLPLGLMTEWYWSGTLGAFADMLKLRLANDAQKESQMVAQKVADIIKPLFPVAYDALVERSF
ncbi:flavin-dependent thymidylate synthase [Ochrobactrum phage vB_OspM_OC]|nr:flavin-dependent thymidylate synthase [Ochrobactrum phage vB_OspM_OC]